MATALGYSILRRSTDFLYPSCLSGKTLKALLLDARKQIPETTSATCSLTCDASNFHGPGQQLRVQARRNIPRVLDIPLDRDVLGRPDGPEKCSRQS